MVSTLFGSPGHANGFRALGISFGPHRRSERPSGLFSGPLDWLTVV